VQLKSHHFSTRALHISFPIKRLSG
jgi:hypothetical protein